MHKISFDESSGIYVIDENVTSVSGCLISGVSLVTFKRDELITAGNDGTYKRLTEAVSDTYLK